MQNQRQLRAHVPFDLSPYSARQRFLSGTLGLAVTVSVGMPPAIGHVAATPTPAPVPTTHAGHSQPSAGATTSAPSPTLFPAIQNTTVLHTLMPTTATHIHHFPNDGSGTNAATVSGDWNGSNTTSSNQTGATAAVNSSGNTNAHNHNHSGFATGSTFGTSASTTQKNSALPNTQIGGTSNNLNLGSTQPMFTAGTIANFTSLSIIVGGKTEQVNISSRLTAAELLAAQQALSGAPQTITIGKDGTATGGTYNLNSANLSQLSADLGGALGSVYVPHGVKLVDGVADLDLTGKLVNHGSIVAAASNSNTNDVIEASTIVNSAGAHIITGTGASLPGGLTLDAGLVQNSGVISSGSDLAVNVGTLSNSGTLSAAQSVNLNVPNVTNSGVISSVHSDVTFASTSTINLNSTGGSVKAANGDINFRAATYSGSGDININGGTFTSNNVNLNAGSGNVNVNANSSSGRVNTVADTAHVTVNNGNLLLGNQDIKGDPTYYNTNGDVTILGTIKTNGNDLAIVASRNILTGNFTNEGLDTSSTTGPGGNVTLVAGANFTTDGAPTGNDDSRSTLTLTNSAFAGNGSKTGGFIDLAGIESPGKAQPLTIFTTNSTEGQAGSIIAVAYNGTSKASGNVYFAGIKSNTDLVGVAPSENGDLTIIADGGQNASAPGSILVGNVEGRNISITAGTPTISVPIKILDGTVSGGSFSSSSLAQSSIQFGTLIGANVTIETMSKVDGGQGTAPAIVVAGLGGTDPTIGSPPSGGGNGGNVLINAGSGIRVNAIDATGGGGGGGGNSQPGGSGGKGGLITLVTGTGNIQTSGALNVSGGGGGGGGSGADGGAGGQAGTITISTPGSFIAGGTLYAVEGAAGSSPAETSGGAGGGSYGGGGGGGGASASSPGFGGGGGGGTYGGGGGGGRGDLAAGTTGGQGGSSYTGQLTGLGGIPGSGNINGTAGSVNTGGTGGGGTGIGGTGQGISGSDGAGVAGLAVTTTGGHGVVNLTFGDVSYAGTAAKKTAIVIDSTNVNLIGTGALGSVSVANNSGIGSMVLAANLNPKATLTVNAAGGDLNLLGTTAGVINVAAPNGTLTVNGTLNAATSASLSGGVIDAFATIIAPSLTLAATNANSSITATSMSANNLTVNAIGHNAQVSLFEVASSAGATNVLASTVGAPGFAGTFNLFSAQQINLNGAINVNSGGTIEVQTVGNSGNITINASQSAGSGTIQLFAGAGQAIVDPSNKTLQALAIDLSGASVGTSVAPILTNAYDGSTSAQGLILVGPTAGSTAFISDANTKNVAFETSGLITGKSLSLTSVASSLQLESVGFDAVKVTDGKGAVTIGNSSPVQIGTGAGAVSVTADSSITESAGVLAGTTVTLVSSRGSIGAVGPGTVSVNSPGISATASKGSVFVEDTESGGATISGAAAITGTNIFIATNTGNLTTSGTISGADIKLVSTGGSLVLGGDLMAASTGVISLSGSTGLSQTTATTSAKAAEVDIFVNTGNTGSETAPISTIASKLVIQTGQDAADFTFVKNTGAVTIGDVSTDRGTFGANLNITSTGAMTVAEGVSASGLSNFTAAGKITLGDGTTDAAFNNTDINGTTNLISTAGGITVNHNYSVSSTFLNFTSSTGAIVVDGSASAFDMSFTSSAKSALVVSGSGTLLPSFEVDLTSGTGGITVAPSSTLATVLSTAGLGKIMVDTTGSFALPLAGLTAGDQVSVTASSVVYNGTVLPAPTVFSLVSGSAGSPGQSSLTLTGTMPISLATTGTALSNGNVFNTYEVYSSGAGSTAGGGTDSISTAGTLTTSTTGPIAFTTGANLSLQGSSVAIIGSLDNENGSGAYGTVSLTATGSTVFLLGGGGTNGTTGSISGSNVSVTAAPGIKVTTTVNLESPTGTLALNTAALTFGTGANVNVDDGTLKVANADGAVSIASTNGSTSSTYQNIGNIDIEAGKGNMTLTDPNLLAVVSSPTTQVNSLTLIATGSITLPTLQNALYAKDSIDITAASVNFDKAGFSLNSYNSSSDGSVNLATTDALIVGGTGLSVNVQAPTTNTMGGSVTLASGGKLTVDGSAIFYGLDPFDGFPALLSLTGTNLALSNLPVNSNLGNLDIISNSATALTLGATTAAQKTNGIDFGTGANPLIAQNITIENTGGAIVAGAGLKSPVAAANTLILVANSGITGTSTTSNLDVSATALSVNSNSGNVYLDIQASLITEIFGIGTGSKGTLNLVADGNILDFQKSILNAGTFRLSEINGATIENTVFINATTVFANVASNESLNIIDSTTSTVNIGASSAGTFTLSSGGNINVTGAINAGGVPPAGVFLTAGGAKGAISFAAGGTINATVDGGQNVVLTAGTGGITNVAGTAPAIVADNLTLISTATTAPTTALRAQAGTLVLKQGAFNIDGVATSPDAQTVIEGDSITSLNYTTSALTGGTFSNVTVSGINTTNGSIAISARTKTLDITGNVTTQSGSISILNSDKAGALTVESGKTIYGSGTTAGVGNVTLAIGKLPTPGTESHGTVPPNATVTVENGGQLTFTTTANPTGSITVAGNATLTANGRNLAFSEGTGGGVITLNDGVTIIADPPAGAITASSPGSVMSPAVMPTYSSVSDFRSSSVLGNNSVDGVAVSIPRAALASLVEPTLFGSSADATATATEPGTAPGNSGIGGSSTGSTGSNGVFASTGVFASSGTTNSIGALALSTLNNSPSANLTTLASFTSTAGVSAETSGLTFAAFNSQNATVAAALPSTSSIQAIQALQAVQAVQAVQPEQSQSFQQSSDKKPLVGAVSNATTFEEGVMLLAPTENQILQTAYGSIGVAKNSLVLAIAFERGIALYNLHDTKRGAVSFNFNNHKIMLALGQHALLTDRSVESFEQINPISCVAYRNVDARDLGDGVKCFQAEFNILSIIRGVEPIKQMLQSLDPHARKMAQSALKNAALTMQLSNCSKPYEYMNLPAQTAMR
jgi:hypothetical protein